MNAKRLAVTSTDRTQPLGNYTNSSVSSAPLVGDRPDTFAVRKGISKPYFPDPLSFIIVSVGQKKIYQGILG